MIYFNWRMKCKTVALICSVKRMVARCLVGCGQKENKLNKNELCKINLRTVTSSDLFCNGVSVFTQKNIILSFEAKTGDSFLFIAVLWSVIQYHVRNFRGSNEPTVRLLLLLFKSYIKTCHLFDDDHSGL